MWPFKKKNQRKNPRERKPQHEQVSPERGLKVDSDEGEYIPAPYYAKVIKERDHGSGYWNTLRVGVFKRVLRIPSKNPSDPSDYDEIQIGEYVRNYSSLMQTFYPFKRNGQWYALYSKDYTCTRVMTLPDCKDIGGEKPDGFGFCPVEFFVPKVYRCRVLNRDEDTNKWEFEHTEAFAPFGFVAGCVWGDDSSWKIQYLDLSRVNEGVIKREDKFGYIELPENVRLTDAVGEVFDWDDERGNELLDHERCYQYSIACAITFRAYADGKLTVFGKEDIADSAKEKDE